MPVDFSLQHLLIEKSIRLQTRLGNDIVNAIASATPSFKDQQIHGLFIERYPAWEVRKTPTAGYNCAGHVWASRRTAIYDDSEYRKVFQDDGYRKTRSPREDDLAVYGDERGAIVHVAKIVRFQPGVASTSEPIPIVVSKLNDMSGEFVHAVSEHPFGDACGDVAIEFWTDRENEAN